MKQDFSFKVEKVLDNSMGRIGVIKTPHGSIKTPAFIAGGTKATVKSLTPEMLQAIGCQAVLANTYHLILRPGADIINKAGGLAKFMHWDGPTFTDSGGFQVFSLGMAYKKGIDKVAHTTRGDKTAAQHSKDQLATISNKQVEFRSHIDGKKLVMSPESSMQLQHKIGADIHFAFDEALAPLASRKYIAESVERTSAWAKRCLVEHDKQNKIHTKYKQPLQALFGIIQGARHEDLRRQSAKTIGSMEFDGFGIGGIYEPRDIATTMKWVLQELPTAKPRHLLGMGSQPADLFLGVEYGVDTFDCVAPTRQARNGSLYTKSGRINILNSKYINDFTAVDDCQCYVCQNYTKAYLNHLFKSDEILATTLASIHNEYFVISTVDKIRSSIKDGTYFAYKKDFLTNYYGKKAAKAFLGSVPN